MKTPDPKNLIDAQGRKIEINFFANIKEHERSRESAWVLHALTLKVEGSPAGYMKISYIPSENASRFYPDIFHYAENFGHIHLKSYPALEQRIPKIIDSGLVLLLPSERTRIENTIKTEPTEKALHKIYQKLIKEAHPKIQAEYKRFLTYHVDKPLIDNVKLYNEYDDQYFSFVGPFMQTQKRNSNESYRNQSLAPFLYEAAAEFMSLNNLELHASDTQSPEAKKLWEKMENKSQVIWQENRRIFRTSK